MQVQFQKEVEYLVYPLRQHSLRRNCPNSQQLSVFVQKALSHLQLIIWLRF